MKLKRLIAICAGIFGSGIIGVVAQSSTSVENLTSVSSAAVKGGLGFNLGGGITNQWEFQMAQAAGATEVRFQPGWSNVQSMSGAFSLGTSNEQALTWCSTYGLQPDLVAAYGAPYKALSGAYTVAANYPIGTYTIQLNQSVAAIAYPYCHVLESNGTQITATGFWAYAGAFIASVNTANNTITLSAPTAIALTSGQALTVNQLLYPSCQTNSATDPSVVAYGNYVAYVAGRINAHGLTGRVEIWNEPPWEHDQWDGRLEYYSPASSAPANVTGLSPNAGFAHLLADTVLPPAGVTYNWGGPEKSGSRSLIVPSFMTPPLTATEVANGMAHECFHPYGDAPEDQIGWSPTLLANWTGGGAGAQQGSQVINGVWWYIGAYCGLPGTNHTGNFIWAHKYDLINSSLGFRQNVTETGADTYLTTAGWQAQAKWSIRHYLCDLIDGMERVNFYILADANDGLSMVNPTTQAPYAAYTALQGLVATDMGGLSVAPLAYTQASLPSVPAYSGTFPLTIYSIVGRTATTDTMNTIYFIAYQRSEHPPNPVKNLTATAGNGKVVLTWTADGFGDSGNVSRSSVEGGPYTLLGNVTETYNATPTYTDTTAVNGATYYYVVNDISPGGIGTNSNEVSAQPSSSGTGVVNNDTNAAGASEPGWLYGQVYGSMTPPAVNITVQLPSGYTATKAWDLVTRAAVPITPGTGTVTYPVSDDPISLAVVPTPTPPAITSSGPQPSGAVGATYSFAFQASGYPPPTFTLTSGSQLPQGLTLSSAGVISGTPTASGTFTGTVDATNGVGSVATQNYTIIIVGAPTDTPTLPLWGSLVLAALLVASASGLFSKPRLSRNELD